jgi:AcrR family transcriptional regulator
MSRAAAVSERVAGRLQTYAGRPPIDKASARRAELADAALATLAELGYARTSLRDIAQNSEFTHGVLHYYFEDKVDLICCCVRQYKARRIERYDQVSTVAQTREAMLDGLCAKLSDTLTNEAKMHRLWYDLRSQALFDSAFRDDVREIDENLEASVWRFASRYAELGGKQVAISKGAFYALCDGLFQKHLLRFLSGDQEAVPDLIAEVRRMMPTLA